MDSTDTFILFALFAGASALGLRVDTNGVTAAQATTTRTCDVADNWRYKWLGSHVEINDHATVYGGETTWSNCLAECRSDPKCKQTVLYDQNGDDTGHCYAMNEASSLDQDNKGGSNADFKSAHCSDTTSACQSTQTWTDPQLYTINNAYYGAMYKSDSGQLPANTNALNGEDYTEDTGTTYDIEGWHHHNTYGWRFHVSASQGQVDYCKQKCGQMAEDGLCAGFYTINYVQSGGVWCMPVKNVPAASSSSSSLCSHACSGFWSVTTTNCPEYPQVQFVAPGAMTIGAVKVTCQALGDGWQPVSIQNVDHVKWLVSQADAQGIDLTVHAGVPLAYDPSNQNKYFDLNDATREVTSIFASLNAEGWPGDYHTNQAASCGGRGQPFAGFGWRSQATPGIEDWGDCHSFNKLLCEKKEAAAGEASTSSSYTTQQGLCRQDAKYGGWCSCECAGNRCATAADCFAKAANMASVMAVEYRTSNQQCALLHSSQDAPTDCPADCDPAGGNGDVTVYTGDGNSDNVCMHPAEDSSTEAATEAGTITVPAGTSRAATRNILEAQCVNFDHLGGDYFFKLNMGDVNDYYRPTNKADKLCDVLLAENPNAKFDWAPTEDGEFKTPDRYGDNFGGSAENWLPEQGIAGDDRKWLSVWMGSSDWQTAGCCVVDYADSGAQWGRGYIITVMSTKGTEAPAPAPVSESAAKGDPHLMNLKGEAFDVMQTGNMMLLEIPRGSSPAALDLALHADIERLGVVSCGPTFITSASIRGRWIGVPLEIRSGPISKEGRHQPKDTFAIRFDEKAWLPHAEMQRTMELSKDATIEAHDRMFLLQVRGLDIAVSQPKRPRIFLDIQVKGLGNLKTEIGGLLGMDDHSSVEELPSECEVSASSLSLNAMRNDEALQWSARALL